MWMDEWMVGYLVTGFVEVASFSFSLLPWDGNVRHCYNLLLRYWSAISQWVGRGFQTTFEACLQILKFTLPQLADSSEHSWHSVVSYSSSLVIFVCDIWFWCLENICEMIDFQHWFYVILTRTNIYHYQYLVVAFVGFWFLLVGGDLGGGVARGRGVARP